MDTGPGRTGRPWRRLHARIKSLGLPCHWCREAIDHTLVWPHPRSFTVDHIIALDDGGHATDPANLAGMHKECNEAKERARRKQQRLNASPRW